MAGWIPGTGELSIAFIATFHFDIKSMTAEDNSDDPPRGNELDDGWSGIAHSERTPLEDSPTGIQFWVALPKSLEEMDPGFLHLEAGELPVLADRQVSVRIIAGTAFGHGSPLRAPHPMLCMDVTLAKSATWQLPADYPSEPCMWRPERLRSAAQATGRGNCWSFRRRIWSRSGPPPMRA